MNVKPGDFARIVNAPENNGAIVSVLRAAPAHLYEDFLVDWEVTVMNAVRAYDTHGAEVDVRPGQTCAINDQYLRRIDLDGDDETLTWAGKPEHEAA